MVYYAEALFPGEEEIDAYPLRDVYPFPLFWNKRLSSLPLSDIVVLYGNNGSGKSTVLNIIGEALRAKRDAPLFDDTTYTLDHNVAYHPFSSFVKMTRLKVALDPYGSPVECPSEIRFFTSDGLFRDIEARRRENRILREEKEAAYKDRREKAGQRYRFSSLEDLDGLMERNAAFRSTERQWAERLGKAEEERSNGESSLDVFASILDNPGLYLVDEPENCLSPLNQSRLATLLFDAAFHNRSQLIVASHSPFILAIPGAKVIDLDEEPPREKKWNELPNIRLYRDFFLSNAKDFD